MKTGITQDVPGKTVDVGKMTNPILIGSRALALRGLKLRDPKDWDWICTNQEANELIRKLNPRRMEDIKGKKIIVYDPNAEFEIIKEGSSSEEFKKLALADGINTEFGIVPSLDLLFTLKQSHRYLKNSPHFWKTWMDWHRLRDMGCKIRPEYQDFLKLREKETYSYQHPSLNQTKKQFFADDNIKYVYDHDSIHRAVAIKEKPAYTYYMKNGSEVQCDKEKFFSLPEEYRINGVIEEACVLAIERSLVPFPGKNDSMKAWLFAYSKIATSITSGWFRQWSYENGPKILKIGPQNYYERFLEGVKSGKVIKL